MKRAKRIGVSLVVMLAVLPAFSQGPKTNDGPQEFYFTRLMYTDIYNRGPMPGEGPPDPATLERNRGYGDRATQIFGRWMMDTWDADIQYMWGIQRLTNISLSVQPHPLPIMWKDLFDYPYIYAVEPGYLKLNDAEAARLREYLLRGGFLHVDDFHGGREWAQFVSQIKKVFPDRAIVDLPITHPIFHTFYDIDHIIQVPNRALAKCGKLPAAEPVPGNSGRHAASHSRNLR